MGQSNRQGGTDRDVINYSGLKLGVHTEDMGAAQGVVTVDHPALLYMDPGGGSVDLLLPVEADSEGLMFIVVNTADAAETISVKEDSDTTVVASISQSEMAVIVCDGVTWRSTVGTST